MLPAELSLNTSLQCSSLMDPTAKQDYIEEIKEEVLIMDPKNKSYTVLDQQMYTNIQNGNVRF